MRFSNAERRLLILLATIQFTSIVDFMIMMPLGPSLMRTLEIFPDRFALLVSAYTLTASVSGLFAAVVIDRFDRKRALQIVYLGFSLGTIWCGLASTYQWLLLARALTGMFGGVLGTLVLSIVGDVIAAEKRGAAMGIVMMSFSLASVVGVPLGLFLATYYSAWEAPFIVLGAFSVIVTILIAWLVPALRGHLTTHVSQTNRLQIFKRIFTNRDQRLAMVLILSIMLGQFAVIPFISPYLVANCGVGEEQLSYIYIAGGAVTIFSGPLIGRAVDRFGVKRMLPLLLLLSLIPFWLVTHLGVQPLPIIIAVTTLFFIISSGRFIAAQTLISMTVSPAERGGFMSLINSMQQLGAALGSYVAGLIIQKGAGGSLLHYSYVGYFAMILSVLSLGIANLIRGNVRARAEVLD